MWCTPSPTTLTLGAVEAIGASKKDGQRAKICLRWVCCHGRELEHSEAFIRRVARKPESPRPTC